MIWLTVVSGTAAALRLALTDAPQPTGTVEWPQVRMAPRGCELATAAAAVAVTGPGTHVAGGRCGRRPSGPPAAVRRRAWARWRRLRCCEPSSWQAPIPAGRGAAGVAPPTRLYCAAGRPINDAAVAAAERVRTPAFAPAATAINLALAAGRDPLTAAVGHFAGSTAETLVATLAAADRGGAGATDLIDRLIAQAVKSLEDARRVRIEALGRAVSGTATLAAVTASAVVVLALLASTRIGL